MASSLQLDPASVTACVNDLLTRSPGGVITRVACVLDGGKVRLTLFGIRTGLSVFGMNVPPIDAELLLLGAIVDGRLRLTWSIERVEGIPTIAAKLVGKSSLAKMLRDALGNRWGLDQALSADDDGDFLLDPKKLRIPGCDGLQFTSLTLPGPDGYVLKADFVWKK